MSSFIKYKEKLLTISMHYFACRYKVVSKSGVQVIFLHRGSAATDGTEQDGEGQQRQWRKKTKRPVLSGGAKQEWVVP